MGMRYLNLGPVRFRGKARDRGRIFRNEDEALVDEGAVVGGVVRSEEKRHAVESAAAEATAALAETTLGGGGRRGMGRE